MKLLAGAASEGAIPSGGPRLIPYNPPHAPPAPCQDLACLTEVWARRVPDRPRALSRRAPACACADLLARPVGAPRGPAAPRARGSRSYLFQVRADALDEARPDSARHRRRACTAAGPRAAFFVGGRDGDPRPWLRSACQRGGKARLSATG